MSRHDKQAGSHVKQVISKSTDKVVSAKRCPLESIKSNQLVDDSDSNSPKLCAVWRPGKWCDSKSLLTGKQERSTQPEEEERSATWFTQSAAEVSEPDKPEDCMIKTT